MGGVPTIRLKKKNRWQKFFLSLPVLLIGVTGPTRIYLGDHWASDVLGGYLFGSAWLGIFVQLYGRLRRGKV
ncbi:MAG: phosphatase PAP2 family protein [Ktedonobacteraceae bacterium]